MTSATDLTLVREYDGLKVSLHPLQGLWTEEQYLRLSDHTRHLIEFTDGMIEVLPMPTDKHQVMLLLLYDWFRLWVDRLGGKVLVAPLRLQIRPGKHREPDILLVRDAHDPRRQNRYWLGADLVVEIVSPDDPERDTVVKVVDYAEAGIAEYWLVDPVAEQITVLTLDGAAYVAHGRFARGEQATSLILPGFEVAVSAVFDAT
ncbi:Uma2 family endonuclease [Candidatus Chloroploca sp. M-50]|uniref:Uma2 family endonuclease n=1 Tax=Candidatus Chloroploca mongolica TaxID=2528176 RepID=A0ABS4DAW1_9CHLR|nr:Uma2 family endonuclease [Candidatus Chloroploca mongolica]MBP1466583.1 Uma2 family endonuclease [Candidatus Chloroploca mongolica]